MTLWLRGMLWVVCVLLLLGPVGCVSPAPPQVPLSVPVAPEEEPMPAGASFTGFPDARFGLFLDEAGLQRALDGLPIPVVEAVSRQAWGLGGRQAVVLAYLGVAPGPGYEVRIRDVAVREGRVVVTVDGRAPTAPSADPGTYTYPVHVRRVDVDDLPPPPFEVVFYSPEGVLLARQDHVRPMVQPLSRIAREEEAGDTLDVVRALRLEYTDRDYRGQNLVRVHGVGGTLFWTEATDPVPGVVVYGPWLPWLDPRFLFDPLTCVVTDRTPEEMVQTLRGSNVQQVLTLRGVWAEVNARHRLRVAPISPEEMPAQAWLACSWSVRDPAASRDWLGTDIVDLYPVRLVQRAPFTVEVVETRLLFHDIHLRIRLHPLPLDSVPLDLVVLEPPAHVQDGETVSLGAYLYYGFDRDPHRLDYVVDLYNDEEGRFYTWLIAPETHVFDLYARLGACRTAEPLAELSLWNPPEGARCDTMSLVQAFYNHQAFLAGLDFDLPVHLRLQIRSPQGWRSEPFTVEIQ